MKRRGGEIRLGYLAYLCNCVSQREGCERDRTVNTSTNDVTMKHVLLTESTKYRNMRYKTLNIKHENKTHRTLKYLYKYLKRLPK
jgi:phage replication-related protein YjqB (UPF0714/DUF867 family)